MLRQTFRASMKALISNSRTLGTSQGVDDIMWHSQGKNASDLAVIVCGWAGSKRPLVEKYTNLLSKDLGCTSAGCILPMEKLFNFDQKAQREFSAQVLELLSSKKDSTDKKTHVVILCLSNNGAIVYQQLVHLCQHEKHFKERFQVDGVILDSAPGPFTWLAYMICGFNLGSNKILQKVLNPHDSNTAKFFRPICTSLLYYYVDIMDPQQPKLDSVRKAWQVYKQFKVNWELYSKTLPWPGNYFLHENESWPILFLYSDSDKLMPSGFIELVIEKQKRLQRSIFSHKFIGSPHVAHLRHHSKDYTEIVSNFIQHVQSNIHGKQNNRI